MHKLTYDMEHIPWCNVISCKHRTSKNIRWKQIEKTYHTKAQTHKKEKGTQHVLLEMKCLE